MVTLRELTYQVEANTKGLDNATKSIDNLVKKLENTVDAINSMGKAFEQQQNRIAAAAKNAGQAQVSSADKAATAAAKQAAAIEQTRLKIDKMKASLEKAGVANEVIGQLTRTFNNYEKSVNATGISSDRTAKNQARLTEEIARSQQALLKTSSAQMSSTRATENAEKAEIRQENALERTRQKYLDLLTALQRTGASQERIDSLKIAFEKYEQVMTGTTLKAKEFSKEQNKLNAAFGDVRRASNITHPALQKLNDQVTNLSKSIQVALGPLSGVASRLTAFTALLNRNTVAIASLIGGVIAFGAVMGKAITAGTEFERQMLKIEAVLKVTDNRLGLTAKEIDNIARRVGDATLTTQGAARNAAAALATFQNIPKQIFEDSLLAAQGLSLIGRGDIQSQIRRVGRILEDPINNIKALTESGIFFNATQERMIQRLQNSGKLLEAQKVVMDRLRPAIAAATGETGGLAGAWDSLGESITSFLQATATSGGAIKTLENAVKRLNNVVKDLNENTNTSITLGRAYEKIIDGISSGLLGLAENFKGVIVVITALLGLKIISWILRLIKLVVTSEASWLSLSGILKIVIKTVARLLVAITGLSLVTLGWVAGIGIAIAAIIYFWDTIEKIGKAIYAFVGRVGNAFLNLLPDEAAESIRRYFDMFISNIKEVIRWVKEMKDAVVDFIEYPLGKPGPLDRMLESTNGPHGKAHQLQPAATTDPAIMRLAAEYDELAKKFLKVSTAEEDASDYGEKLNGIIARMNDIIDSGNAPEDFAGKLERLKNIIDATGSPLRSFNTDLKNQIALTNMQSEASSKMGIERATLDDAIAKEQALLKAGISQYVGQTDALAGLSVEAKKAYENILKLTLGLQEAQRNAKVQARISGLEDEVRITGRQLDLVGQGKFEIDKQSAALQIQLELMKLGLRYDDERVVAAKRLSDIISDNKKKNDYQDELKSLEDNAKLLQKEIDLRGASGALRNEELAQLSDRLELEALYGNDVAKINKLLEERAKLRGLETQTKSLQNVRDLDQEINLRQQELGLLWQSAEARDYALQVSQAEYELRQRFESLDNPQAQAELGRTKALINLQQQIEKTGKAIETVKGSMNSLADTLTDQLLNNELSWKSWKDAASSAIDDVIKQLLQLYVWQQLTNMVVGAVGNAFAPSTTSTGVAGASGGASGHPGYAAPHQMGGVLSGPQVFGVGSSYVKASERGPGTEAIIPLVRGRQGRLGVEASMPGGGNTVNVIINNNNPDNQVTSTRRQNSNGTEDIVVQIDKRLGQMVGRGEGQLSRAIERNYGLSVSPSSR